MNLHSAFNRIHSIDWDKSKKAIDQEKLANLMSDFILNIRSWAEYLQIDYIYPFDDLICFIDPDVQLPEDVKVCLYPEVLNVKKHTRKIAQNIV